MTLEEKIFNDYKQAMKDSDKVASSALNFLRANLKNAAISLKKDALGDAAVISVIKKMVKQRQDSIEQFGKGGREDLVAKEAGELAILKAYLPAEISLEQLKQIIEEVVSETQASSLKDMGKVMKEVIERTASRADAKTVSGLVRERLSNTSG